MSLNGSKGEQFDRGADAVKIAAMEFANDNNGQMPSDPSQLTVYLKQPIDAITVQKYLKGVIGNPPPPEVATLAPALKAYTDANGGKTPEHPLDPPAPFHTRTTGSVFTTRSNAARSCRADARVEGLRREPQRTSAEESGGPTTVSHNAGTRGGASETGAMEDARFQVTP
jgi:hypothetical protein